MSRGQSQGQCFFCKAVVGRQAMIKHLQSCEKMPPKDSDMKRYLLILVEGRYDPVYWLYLAVSKETTLKQLDHFLREIWLECCGHASAFEIEGRNYSSSPGMNKSIGNILSIGMKFRYEYDFGSTTELTLKIIDEQEMALKKPVQLLARNEAPLIKCDHCGESAAKICSECVSDEKGLLCPKCVTSHECDEEMLLPVVNSPRMGVCGYEG